MSNIRIIRQFGDHPAIRMSKNMVPPATFLMPDRSASPIAGCRSEVNMTSVAAQPEPSTLTEQTVSPTPELLDHLAAESLKLETATPWEIVEWAVDQYYPKLTMATAFGPEGCVIIHMLAKIEPRVHVFNLDTGYQFKETLELRDKIAKRYGIEVELKQPETTVEVYEALHGGPLYRTNPDQCCA